MAYQTPSTKDSHFLAVIISISIALATPYYYLFIISFCSLTVIKTHSTIVFFLDLAPGIIKARTILHFGNAAKDWFF